MKSIEADVHSVQSLNKKTRQNKNPAWKLLWNQAKVESVCFLSSVDDVLIIIGMTAATKTYWSRFQSLIK